MSDNAEFVPAHSVKFHWMYSEVSFDCSCGAKEIVLIENGETFHCDCGKIYRLVHYVEEGTEKEKDNG